MALQHPEGNTLAPDKPTLIGDWQHFYLQTEATTAQHSTALLRVQQRLKHSLTDFAMACKELDVCLAEAASARMARNL